MFGRWMHSLDDGPAEPLLDDLRVLGHREDDGEGEAILARQETAHLLAQRRWQHRDGALYEVDAGRPLPCIAVESSVGLDEVRHIGNVHTDVVRPVFVGLDGNSIVEVLRVLGINSEDTLAAEVLANFQLALGDAGKDGWSFDPMNGDRGELTSKAWAGGT